MHNLGCCYESQQRFEMAQNWFFEAYRKRDELKSYFGFAVCNYKLGQVEKSIQALDKAIDILEDQATE